MTLLTRYIMMGGMKDTDEDWKIKMPKYKISYQTEDWWDLFVEADTLDDVLANFWNGEYNHSDAVLVEGGYIQDSVSVDPVED
jgi:hypothetical protein